MIGQAINREIIDKFNIINMPHFIILIGEAGSGKRTLAKYIANKYSLVYSECEISTEAVRSVIDTAYKADTKVLYCFPNADIMKAQAKNAMLKITEEPPKNAYFCLTINDDSTLLDTLRSRAFVMYMEPYFYDEIQSYLDSLEVQPPNRVMIFYASNNIGQAKMFIEYGQEFFTYVKLVFDNIANVEPANAFKIGQKLALKNEPDKYDLKAFLIVFNYMLNDRFLMNYTVEDCEAIKATTKALNRVDRVGVNKQQLFDMWVFDVRSALLL